MAYKSYSSKVEGYVSECAALVFIRGASAPMSDHSMLRRANTIEVAKKIRRIPDVNIAFAHVVAGPTDIIALVHATSSEKRREAVAAIRSIKNLGHVHNFVYDSVSHLVISMYGRPPVANEWKDRKKFCGWMLAKVSEAGPADWLAERLLAMKQVTFVAPLIGEFDLAVFIEEDGYEEFGKFIDDAIGGIPDFYFSDTRILWPSQGE